eukprot:g2496.t1
MHVTEDEMQNYFEAFGEVEDAYRPRDMSKNTFRGIGFVTFVNSTTTDKVIAIQHKLGGAEVVVDRANPKTPSLASAPKTSISSLEDLTTSRSLLKDHHQCTLDCLQNTDCLLGEDPGPNINSVQNPKSSIGSYATSTETNHGSFKSNLSDDLNDNGIAVSCESNANASVIENSPKFRTVKSRRNLRQSGSDNLSHVRKVRGGPRIFVGKLAKETIEQDLAEYFSKFGFVMDVYIPRSKENKREHRGFGFVTFETEASIKRTVAQGTHTLKGAVLAIDVAVPEDSMNY